jgi:hypothetical protein
MRKVAYLLGAGASAQRLPVIASMSAVILEQVEWLKNEVRTMALGPAGSIAELNGKLDKYLGALDDLAVESVKYVSVDTYARWLSNDRKLSEIKAALSTFFAIEQFRKGYDPRYESFVSTLLDHDEKAINKDAVILTWNYDQHLAQVLKRATGSSSVRDVMRQHSITTLHRLQKMNITDYHVLHLNGIAGMYGRGTDHPILDRYEPGSLTASNLNVWLSQFELLSQERYTSSDSPTNLMCYTWEAPDVSDPFWNGITASLADVEKVVVIGYSFPDLNRAIDRRLLLSMSKLTEVVVQTRADAMDGIMTKLQMILPELQDRLVPYPLVHEFYVPNELITATEG